MRCTGILEREKKFPQALRLPDGDATPRGEARGLVEAAICLVTFVG